MIKKLLLWASFFVLWAIQVFAYTPDAWLSTKLDQVVWIFQQMIEDKGEPYRDAILWVLDSFQTRYAGNERAEYILWYIWDALAPAMSVSYADTFLGSYSIDDPTYGGTVEVIVDESTRAITSNALPNHETGTFPNPGNPNTMTAQSRSRSFPLEGEYAGNAVRAREMWVAVNGVKFEPETNERVECETWETYRVEAFQDVVPMGTDHNHAHVQPTGEYHYHGVPTWLVEQLEGDDIVHVGFAADGHKIVYSKQGTYSSSFQLVDEIRPGSSCTYRGNPMDIEWSTPDGTYVSDRVHVEGLGDLDSCNGMMLDGEYVYFMTDEYPYMGRCLQWNVAGGWWGPGGAWWPPPGWWAGWRGWSPRG